MAPARTLTAAVDGIGGRLVEIGADLPGGRPGFIATGLPGIDLHSTRDRIRAAILNSGEDWPTRRIAVTLTPLGPPAPSAMSDVALALAVLAAPRAIPAARLTKVLLLGELGLDGRIRDTHGVLPAVAAAARAGIRRALVPVPNLAEAQSMHGMDVRGVAELPDLLAFLRGIPTGRSPSQPASSPGECSGGEAGR